MRFLNLLAAAVFCVLAVRLSGAELPAGIDFRKNGTFGIGGSNFQVQFFSDTWRSTTNDKWKRLESGRTGESLTVSAAADLGGVPVRVEEHFTALEPGRFRFEFRLLPEEPAVSNTVAAQLDAPPGFVRAFADGKEISLPEKLGKEQILGVTVAKELRFLLDGGRELTVAGVGTPLKFMVQDDRKFGYPRFSFRFLAAPDKGRIEKAAELKLDFRYEEARSTPVDLGAIADRGFSDDPAGVRGWTGQGPENDLSMFRPADIASGALKFAAADPAAGSGRGVAAVAGAARKLGAPVRGVELPAGTRAKALALLHTSAWTPEAGGTVGEIEVVYGDGSTERIPVISGRDCGNWWLPLDRPNATVAWRGSNRQAEIGLFASCFPLRREDPRRLVFRVDPASESVWMIVAASLADRPVLPPAAMDRKVVRKAGPEYLPLRFSRKVVAGGALDFSAMNDAPAGKYGFVRPASDGTLTFEKAPGRRVRFYGPNLVHSANFLSKKTADETAAFFRYMGYNSVRFHHYDQRLLDPKAADSLTFDPAQLDRLDYLFAKMKEQGVYTTIDLFSLRTFRPGDGIAECDFYDEPQLKHLVPISRGAMANWKEFARRLLTHVNPYTGLAWSEDPALYCINLVNEDSLSAVWNRHPSGAKLYREAFATWRRERNLPESAADSNNPEFLRFLSELQAKYLEEQLAFLRDELNVRSMLTSLNWQNDTPYTLLRDRFDLVDNHSYFDHPRFPEQAWRLPMQFRQGSAIRNLAATPQAVMASRIFGKPFIVTEFNYCNPNRFRAEAGPLIGAYAALQNWDGLCRFAWASNSAGLDKLGHAYSWDAMADPLGQLSERLAIMMFRRGDVAAAGQGFAWAVPADPFRGKEVEKFSDAFLNLGLVAAIGSVQEGAKLPAAVAEFPHDGAPLPFPAVEALRREIAAKKIASSVTGQLRLDAENGTFTVNSPRTASVTLPSGSAAAGVLGVTGASCFQTVAAVSLDGEPLTGSRSILLLQLTEQTNTGLTDNAAGTMLYDWGKLPLLLRRGSAGVALALPAPCKVTALNADGEPCGEVKAEYRDGVLRFRADTGSFPCGVMAYHLTR